MTELKGFMNFILSGPSVDCKGETEFVILQAYKKTVADTRKRVICASNALGTIFAHGCA